VQGDDRLFDSALRQVGAVRAQGIEEFFDLCAALERFGDLGMQGNRVALATLPGGEGVIATDLCQIQGLAMASANEGTLEKMRPVFPPWDIEANPFDLGVCLQFGNPKLVYGLYLEAMMADPDVDAVAVMLPRVFSTLSVGAVEPFRRARDTGKPVVAWIPGMHAGGYPPLEQLEEHHVPVFPSPERAIRALAALYRSSSFKGLGHGG
jgi:acyl-CoA synthetase (NDP forming)